MRYIAFIDINFRFKIRKQFKSVIEETFRY
jgi:hypothetical protein